MVSITKGNIKDALKSVNKDINDPKRLEWSRWTVKVWPRQRALCYRELMDCLFKLKASSIKSMFYSKGFKLSVPCDVAKFIQDRLDKDNFTSSGG